MHANIADQRWSEAGQAGSSIQANAGIAHSCRARTQQTVGQILRGDIALRIETFGKFIRFGNVVKLTAKIREIIIIGYAFFSPVDFGELNRLVKGNFRL